MSAAELRKKSEEELNEELLALRREQFNLRMQKGTGQLSKPSEVKRVRRQIARLGRFVCAYVVLQLSRCGEALTTFLADMRTLALITSCRCQQSLTV